MSTVEMAPMGASAPRPSNRRPVASPWGNVSLAGYKKDSGHGGPGRINANSTQPRHSALHVPDLSLVDTGEWHKDLARAHYVVVTDGENKDWLDE
jgi:hypothetical protein